MTSVWTVVTAIAGADNPEHPRRHVTVLHIYPVTSPILAVRAAIVQEQRSLANEES
jgi:hypothetical protein